MRFRLLAFSSILTGAIAASRSPSPAFLDGWKFTWKVTRVDEGPKAKNEPDASGAQPSMAVQVAGPNVRMDFIDDAGAKQGMPRGGFMLLNADSSTVTMVNPQEKKAMVMDPAGLGSALGAMGNSGLLKMEIANPEVKVEDVGAGDAILGRATHHYRITRTYDMNIQVAIIHRSMHHVAVSDAFLTKELIDDRAFAAFAEHMTRSVQGSGEGLKKMMEAEKDVPRGFPLRVITKSTDTDSKGEARVSTVTVEMQDLQRANIDAGAFRVPDGYEVVDTRAQMAEMSKQLNAPRGCPPAPKGAQMRCTTSTNYDSINRAVREDCERKHGKGNCETNIDKMKKMMGDTTSDGGATPSTSSDSTSADSTKKGGAKEGAKKLIKGIFGRKKP